MSASSSKAKPPKRPRLQKTVENSPASDNSDSDSVEYYDSLVNRLTKEEVDAVIEHYKTKYKLTMNEQGCEIMGEKVKQPRKRAGYTPKWEPLARKSDGYLQVTVAGLNKESERYKELFPKGKVQKVEWHRLCWRQQHDYAQCKKNYHICHRCGNRDCGTAGHLAEALRDINEEQKHCRYVYTEDEDQRNLYLLCPHQPPCIPKLDAIRIHPVNNTGLINSVRFQ